MDENAISYKIRGAVFAAYNALGPGLLESTYEIVLMYLLEKEGLRVRNQVALPLVYEDIKLDAGYRIDLLVEEKVIIEA